MSPHWAAFLLAAHADSPVLLAGSVILWGYDPNIATNAIPETLYRVG